MQSPARASSLAETPPAASPTGAVGLSAGAAIRDDPGPASGAAAAVVAASTTALAFGRLVAIVFIAVRMAWSNRLAVFAMCISIS